MLEFFLSQKINKLLTYTSILSSEADLVCLKTKIVNLNVDKLKTVPNDLNMLSNVVDSDVLKITVYDKLVIKVNAIDTNIQSTSGIVTKVSMHDSVKNVLEKKTEDVDKKYTILVDWSKTMTRTQKLQIL